MSCEQFQPPSCLIWLQEEKLASFLQIYERNVGEKPSFSELSFALLIISLPFRFSLWTLGGILLTPVVVTTAQDTNIYIPVADSVRQYDANFL